MKVLIAIFLLLSALEARENPFFPSDGEKEIPYTANENKALPNLKRATITLPSKARVLESVTVKYKNLDGSIESKTVDVENTIDWHLPIFISQSYSAENEKPQVQTQVKEKAKKSPEPKKMQGNEKVASIAFADFYTFGKNFKITTKDELIRDFLLAQPHRIVLDFKRDAVIPAYAKANPDNIFSKIRVGNHSGYYRVVVELDGYYRYKLEKTEDGYTIKLK
jgi:5,10-methenyltetrahydromethanopterin hydrogenase